MITLDLSISHCGCPIRLDAGRVGLMTFLSTTHYPLPTNNVGRPAKLSYLNLIFCPQAAWPQYFAGTFAFRPLCFQYFRGERGGGG